MREVIWLWEHDGWGRFRHLCAACRIGLKRCAAGEPLGPRYEEERVLHCGHAKTQEHARLECKTIIKEVHSSMRFDYFCATGPFFYVDGP